MRNFFPGLQLGWAEQCRRRNFRCREWRWRNHNLGWPDTGGLDARHRKDLLWQKAEFVGQGVPSHAAHQAAYWYVLPSLRRNIRKLYMAKIDLNEKLRRDGVHKQIMTTKRRLEDNENFSADEAMRYAIKKRKYLIQDVTGTLNDCEL